MTAILEINDYELTLYQNGERLYHAPAMAIVREPELSFGEAARREFRLFPRQANQQYFAKLNAEPLSQPTRAAANHADLVYLHLKELQQLSDNELVLAVPGNLNADQLGVLLGIAQEAGFQIRGFVDSAVAALSEVPAPETVVHLDIHLQHAVLTQLTVGQNVNRGQVDEVRDCGISNLVDAWVNLITDRFVSTTRFDPLHTADTEQQLYSQVYEWLNGPRRVSELSVIVAHGGSERSVEIAVADLEAKALSRYRGIVDAAGRGAHVMLSARAFRLPGLVAALKQAGCATEPLPASAVGDGCAGNLALIVGDGEQLRLIRALPHEHDTPIVAANLQPGAAIAGHLLLNNTAQAIHEVDGLNSEDRSGEPWLLPGNDIRVNDQQLEQPVALRPGDQVTFAQRSYTAIVVIDRS